MAASSTNFDFSHFNEREELALLESSTLTQVELDGLVVLKIIKHCKENLPQLVTGQLLGLDVKTTLQVTDCVPFPKIDENEEEEENENEEESENKGAEYQLEMMRCLREVNVDNNIAGWYTSSYMESFLNKFVIATQYKYQERIKKSVLIVYDPLRTSQGSLSIRAIRLTQPFMELYKTQAFTKESLTKGNISFDDVFEEVPVRIHNSILVNAFLGDLEVQSQTNANSNNVLNCEFDRLDLSTNPFIERNLEFLIDSMDELSTEQTKFRYFQNNLQRQQVQQAAWLQKRRAENAQRKKNGEELLPEEDPSNPIFKQVVEPSRLESMLLTNQINNYCKQVNQFSANSFAKIYLFGELEKGL